MSEPVLQPEDAKPARSPVVLALGLRESIALAGNSPFWPDPDRRGKITILVNTGFVKENGHAYIAHRRTLFTREADAKKVFEVVVLPELRAAWDKKARELGHPPANVAAPASSTQPATPPPALVARCLAQRLDELFATWETHDLHPDTRGAYGTVGRHFVKYSGPLARGNDRQYTEPDCQGIRLKLLGRWDASSGTPSQNMGNLRFVLREVGFPAKLIEVFYAGKRERGHRTKKERSLRPDHIKLMFGNLSQASWEEEGLVLFLANGTMNPIDAALTLTEDFIKSLEAFVSGERLKNTNPFNFVIWERTIDWFNRRLRPDAAHLFWSFLFSPEELAADPDIILTPLSPEEVQRRKRSITFRARKCFKVYIEVKCKLKAAGITPRRFRNTNISGYEASGVPRYVGMFDSGHLKEENYVNYADPTVPQMRSLADIKLQFYEDPDKVFILTHTQSVDATGKNITKSVDATATNIVASEGRIIAAIQLGREESAGLRRENAGLRQENAGLRQEVTAAQQEMAVLRQQRQEWEQRCEERERREAMAPLPLINASLAGASQ